MLQERSSISITACVHAFLLKLLSTFQTEFITRSV